MAEEHVIKIHKIVVGTKEINFSQNHAQVLPAHIQAILIFLAVLAAISLIVLKEKGISKRKKRKF